MRHLLSGALAGALLAQPDDGRALERPVRPGAFFDVVGRRSAVLGYEDRPFEVIPLQ